MKRLHFQPKSFTSQQQIMQQNSHLEKVVLLAASMKSAPSLSFTDICKAFDRYSNQLSQDMARKIYRIIVNQSILDDQFYLKYIKKTPAKDIFSSQDHFATPQKNKKLSLSFTKSMDSKSFDLIRLSQGKERAIYQQIRDRISKLEHPRRMRKNLLKCFDESLDQTKPIIRCSSYTSILTKEEYKIEEQLAGIKRLESQQKYKMIVKNKSVQMMQRSFQAIRKYSVKCYQLKRRIQKNLLKKGLKAIKEQRKLKDNTIKIQMLLRKRHRLLVMNTIFQAFKKITAQKISKIITPDFIHSKKRTLLNKYFSKWNALITRGIISSPKKQLVRKMIKNKALQRIFLNSTCKKRRDVIYQQKLQQARQSLRLNNIKLFYFNFFIFLQQKINSIDLRIQATKFYERNLQTRTFYEMKDNIQLMKQVLQSSDEIYTLKILSKSFQGLKKNKMQVSLLVKQFVKLPCFKLLQDRFQTLFESQTRPDQKQLLAICFEVLLKKHKKIKLFTAKCEQAQKNIFFRVFKKIAAELQLVKLKKGFLEKHLKSRVLQKIKNNIARHAQLIGRMGIMSMELQQTIIYNRVSHAFQKLQNHSHERHLLINNISQIQELIFAPKTRIFFDRLKHKAIQLKISRKLNQRSNCYYTRNIKYKTFRLLSGHAVYRKTMRESIGKGLSQKVSVNLQLCQSVQIDLASLTQKLYSQNLLRTFFYTLANITSKCKYNKEKTKNYCIQRRHITLTRTLKKLQKFALTKGIAKNKFKLLQSKLAAIQISYCIKRMNKLSNQIQFSATIVHLLSSLLKKILSPAFFILKDTFEQSKYLLENCQKLPVYRIRLCFKAAQRWMKTQKVLRYQNNDKMRALFKQCSHQIILNAFRLLHKIKQKSIRLKQNISDFIKKRIFKQWHICAHLLKKKQLIEKGIDTLKLFVYKRFFAFFVITNKQCMFCEYLQKKKKKIGLFKLLSLCKIRQQIKEKERKINRSRNKISCEYARVGLKILHLACIQQIICITKLKNISNQYYKKDCVLFQTAIVECLQLSKQHIQFQYKIERISKLLLQNRVGYAISKLQAWHCMRINQKKCEKVQSKFIIKLEKQFIRSLQFNLKENLICNFVLCKENRAKLTFLKQFSKKVNYRLKQYLAQCRLEKKRETIFLDKLALVQKNDNTTNKYPAKLSQQEIIKHSKNTEQSLIQEKVTQEQLHKKVNQIQVQAELKQQKQSNIRLQRKQQQSQSVIILSSQIQPLNQQCKPLSDQKNIQTQILPSPVDDKNSINLPFSKINDQNDKILYEKMVEINLQEANQSIKQSSLWDQDEQQSAKLQLMNQSKLREILTCWRQQARQQRLEKLYLSQYQQLSLQPNEALLLQFKEYQRS